MRRNSKVLREGRELSEELVLGEVTDFLGQTGAGVEIGSEMEGGGREKRLEKVGEFQMK